ncbi:MAG: FecR domain-containing protein [Pirellulaceae bacterium]
MRLTRGVAEVRFDKGTSARLTAPAEVELVSGDEVSLGFGKLTARVPAKATGFTVTTPVGRVVDVGTEFDVSVNESGTTEARVLDGKVLVLPQRKGELAGID